MWLKRMMCMVLVSMLVLGMMIAPVSAAETAVNTQEGFQMNTVTPRATQSFHITLGAKKTLTADTSFPMAAGETVTITASYSPSSASLDFGLVAPDGSFYYFNETDGSVDRTIQVDETGDYTFQVRNNSYSTVEVSGFVNY